MLCALLILMIAAQAPDTLWSTSIVDSSEPGDPLVVSGVLCAADGTTPVPGAVLYVYHTDAEGNYRRPGSGNAPPRLRGWMKTDALGRYEFRTIRPAPYPNGKIPAHIHASVRRPGGKETSVPEFWFEGDPNIPADQLRAHAGDGRFSPILRLVRGSDGVWRGKRDIRLRN